MAGETQTGELIAVRGFIDGRAQGSHPIYLAFISIAAPDRLEFLGEFVSNDPIDKDISWADLAAMIVGHEPPDDRAHELKSRLHEYLLTSKIAEPKAGVLSEREISHKICSFCSSSLDLNAIAFIDIMRGGRGSIAQMMPAVEFESDKVKQEAASADEVDEGEQDDAPAKDNKHVDIFLKCGPVLDTVNGTAAASLVPGDLIEVELPKDSLYRRFLNEHDPTFEGRVTAQVTKVVENDVGSAVVSVRIAEGVVGSIKITESVRIKRGEIRVAMGPLPPIPPEIILAFISLLIFFGVIIYVLFSYS